MLGLVVISTCSAILAGLFVKKILDWTSVEAQITWSEFLIGSLIISIIVAPATCYIGWKVARSNNLSFNEYWNGWEVEAIEEVTVCTRDGPCTHEYSCDPYLVMETYSCNCDDDGCDTCTRLVTKYHDCPYATHEYDYLISTTLGKYSVGSNHFANNPKKWRPGKAIPSGIPKGPPKLWKECKARIKAGNPGPVTKRAVYDNYILASEQTILKQYSDLVDQYKADNLLPAVVHNVHTWYLADKVSFVGFAPENEKEWQETLMYFNASLGTELQGDLHLVITQDGAIGSNPDAYLIALKAYWQNEEDWGDDAISKNSIIVVLGTEDGQTVSWARAVTGMPLGNEELLLAVRNKLKGVNLTPSDVLGKVEGEFYTRESDGKLKVRGIGEGGVLRRIVWGLDEPTTSYERISMTGEDEDDAGRGFLYLDTEIQPKKGQKTTIVVVTFIMSMLVWTVFAFIGESRRRGSYSSSW